MAINNLFIYAQIFSKSLNATSNIKKFAKQTCNEKSSKDVVISIILTESTASLFDINAQHLQDIKENMEKSKICVLVDNATMKNLNRLPSDNYRKFTNKVEIAYSRCVAMVESSTSVYGMDDLSDDNEETPKPEQNETFYLQPQIVNIQSLMTVRSNAHEGKLVTESDKVYVNVIDNEVPLTSSGWINMCRICHGGESNEELIGPCRCRGSVALAHYSCLERWLRESAKSKCELCQHHYEITREPKYGILKSILVWLCNPGEHAAMLLEDLLSFCLYTPAAVCTTYILMLMCDHAARIAATNVSHPASHIIAFFAVAGIAAIDFTYSSWLMVKLHRHMLAWRAWYRENCCLTLILPPRKRRRRRGNALPNNTEVE